MKKVNSNLFKTAVCALVMLCTLLIIFGMAPFGDATFLTGDLNGQYISFFSAVRSALLSGEGLTYSLHKGLGGGMLGIIAYHVASPFVLLYLLFEPIHYGVVTTFVVLLKIISLCLSMSFFLTKKFKKNSNVVVAISLCYGFCGYVFVYLQNIMWLDVLILLPILCYGIDRLYTTRRPFVYSLTLFLAVVINFYIAYMVCIFLVLYFLYNLVCSPPPDRKGLLCRVGEFSLASLVGGLLGAVFLLPSLAEVYFTKGIGEAQYTLQLTGEFSLWQFLSRMLPFGFDIQRISDDLPNVYGGVIVIILLTVFFASKGIAIRRKVIAFTVLAVLYLGMWSTDFNFLFHGFAEPVWFTHRNSFLFVFWACFLAATAFCEGIITAKTPVVSTVSVAVVLTCRVIFFDAIYTTNRFITTLLLTIILLTLIYIVTKYKTPRVKSVVGSAILLCVAVELTVNAYYTQRQFEQYPNSEYVQFIADTEYLLDEIEAIEGGDDYRVEKTYWRNLNDSMLLDYYGVTHFSSTMDDKMQDITYRTGLSGGAAAVLYDSGGSNIFADSLVGIKYLLVKSGTDIPSGYLPTDITKNDITVYQNPYAFPLGFILPDGDYDLPIENNEEYLSELYSLLSQNEGAEMSPTALAQLSEKLKEVGAEVDFIGDRIVAEITSEREGVVFFSVPYNERLTATVNGEVAQTLPVFNNQLGVRVSEGENFIEIGYSIPLFYLGLLLSVLSAAALVIWWRVFSVWNI